MVNLISWPLGFVNNNIHRGQACDQAWPRRQQAQESCALINVPLFLPLIK